MMIIIFRGPCRPPMTTGVVLVVSGITSTAGSKLNCSTAISGLYQILNFVSLIDTLRNSICTKSRIKFLVVTLDRIQNQIKHIVIHAKSRRW